MVTLRPKGFKPSKYIANVIDCPDDYKPPVFVIHPPTSKLAEMLVVDSTALQNENYSGIYDGSGDYVPQYCDDPEQIPRGALQANSENVPESLLTGTESPEGTSKQGSQDVEDPQ